MTKIKTSADLKALCLALPSANEVAREAAIQRQSELTKPFGSLGRLEELAICLAGWQGVARPVLDQVDVLIFAGSHGITARGVSAFPAEVTAQMVGNFEAGGAAINQLAREAKAQLRVIPLSIDLPTEDFTQAPAMDEASFLEAVNIGYEAVPDGSNLVCVGEMGIGNTTSAAAICASLLGGTGADWVGRGTGIDDAGLQRKADVVDDAVKFHGEILRDPLEVLRRVGGREIAAMFGAMLAARQKSIPILLDGFVTSAAALVLAKLTENDLSHIIAGHVSHEAAHRKLLAELKLSPLLDLQLRLGEGSGACLAINILRSALACHNHMASFAEAGVSGA